MDGSKRWTHHRRHRSSRALDPERKSRQQPRQQPLCEGLSLSKEENYPAPAPLLVGPAATEEGSAAVSNFKLLSMDDLSPTEADTTDSAGKIVGEGATAIAEEYGSDEDEDIEALKPKKLSKAERLKCLNNIIEQFMKDSLKKYNSEENLDEDHCFEFVRYLKRSFIIEGLHWYEHFNFEAVQSGSCSVSLFFAEAITQSTGCVVTRCIPLRDDDNGRCYGCHNQGVPDLKHPSDQSFYAGGHVDCFFPFLMDTDSDSESDE